ncbi:hypothetical protein [Christiangramia echinicola]|uniref:hypothetical protein n=1 Tax=Christiangramia echinicola TaxID=279359 RepID=UPI00041ED371|nr:hypothetical protein [Christiangramia echinicola]
MSKEESIESKLIDQISDSSIQNLAADFTEIALDTILENEVLKDFPVIGTISNVIKASKNIRDKIFAKKVLLFLQSLNDCSLEQREKFTKQIDQNPKKKQKVGEAVIVLLDRIDDMDKPQIIGNLFKAYINEDINYDDFIKMSSIINKINLKDLILLKNSASRDIPVDISENLAFNGLMNIGILDEPLTMDKTHISPTLYYVKNKIASKIFKFGFNTPHNNG